MQSERFSCHYLDGGGLGFYLDTITACSVIHHDRGVPMLARYTGGELPWMAMEAKRAEIVKENQNGGYIACRGCPNLAPRKWQPQQRINWIGISHFNACNLSCSYCWLQWQKGSPRLGGDKRISMYDVLPALRSLMASDRLARDGVVDWGGGGEPTLMPEFTDGCRLLAQYGIMQWVHTNAVRMPRGISDGSTVCSRLRILCSVDAGTRETYARIKENDCLDRVWKNLGDYHSLGAYVVAKYIVTDDNCSSSEIEQFLDRAVRAEINLVLPDIDHRYPDPKPWIIEALARLRLGALQRRLPVQFGSTGVNSAPESRVDQRVESVFQEMKRQELLALKERHAHRVQFEREFGDLRELHTISELRSATERYRFSLLDRVRHRHWFQRAGSVTYFHWECHFSGVIFFDSAGYATHVLLLPERNSHNSTNVACPQL